MKTSGLASEIIPTEKDSLIGVDFNGHSLLWDSIQPTDVRGTEMEDWVISKDLIVLNDGSPTWVNKATGNESTPDVTLCGRAWNNKKTWRVEDPIGSSDHTPILIEVHTKVKHVNLLPRNTRWKSRDGDWEDFKQAVEDEISSDVPSTLTITERITRSTKYSSKSQRRKWVKPNQGRK